MHHHVPLLLALYRIFVLNPPLQGQWLNAPFTGFGPTLKLADNPWVLKLGHGPRRKIDNHSLTDHYCPTNFSLSFPSRQTSKARPHLVAGSRLLGLVCLQPRTLVLVTSRRGLPNSLSLRLNTLLVAVGAKVHIVHVTCLPLVSVEPVQKHSRITQHPQCMPRMLRVATPIIS